MLIVPTLVPVAATTGGEPAEEGAAGRADAEEELVVPVWANAPTDTAKVMARRNLTSLLVIGSVELLENCYGICSGVLTQAILGLLDLCRLSGSVQPGKAGRMSQHLAPNLKARYHPDALIPGCGYGIIRIAASQGQTIVVKAWWTYLPYHQKVVATLKRKVFLGSRSV
jgi:hypothetical protein